jgi:hypothetical protein
MSGKILATLRGSVWLSNSWKQELVITEDGVEGEVIRGLKRIKMMLPYDRIAQVNLIRGVLKADLELVNKGGTDNLVVKALDKSEAEGAKDFIEERMRTFSSYSHETNQISVADELAKLAHLKSTGVLTEEEFQLQKARLLK